MRSRRLFLAAAGVLAGCARYPEPYRPPEQRRPMEITAPGDLSHFIAMNSETAEKHILGGVLGLNDGSWRWCMKRALFQFRVPDNRGKRLLADITIPELTFEQTGPVKISVHIGPHLLDTIAAGKPGGVVFEKPVPPEWIPGGAPVLVSLEIDKMWRSPTDGVERGFILTRLGFLE